MVKENELTPKMKFIPRFTNTRFDEDRVFNDTKQLDEEDMKMALIFSITILFVLMFALLFYCIEGNYQKEKQQELDAEIELAKQELIAWMRGQLPPETSLLSTDNGLEQRAHEFSRKMVHYGRKGGGGGAIQWREDNDGGQVGTWSFPNSLLFTISLMATLGYSRHFPLSPLGKLLSIPIAFVGIILFRVFVVIMFNVWNDHCLPCIIALARKWGSSMQNEIRKRIEGKQKMWMKRTCATFLPVIICTDGVQQREVKGKGDGRPCWPHCYAARGVLLHLSHLHLLALSCAMLAIWTMLATFYHHSESWLWLDSLHMVFNVLTLTDLGDQLPSSNLTISVTALAVFFYSFIKFKFIDDFYHTKMRAKVSQYIDTLCEK